MIGMPARVVEYIMKSVAGIEWEVGDLPYKMVGGSWEVSPICTKLTVER